MDATQLQKWWDNLPAEKKFLYKEDLEDYLKQSIESFIQREDIYVTYYNIQKKTEYRKCVGGFPINFNTDLHADSYNYENFKDCLDEILFELSMNFQYWFFEVQKYGNENKPISESILQKIYS